MKKLFLSLVFVLFAAQTQDGFSAQSLPANMICCPNMPKNAADIRACEMKCIDAGRMPNNWPQPQIKCNQPEVESCPSHCAMGCVEL